jgi:tight adherence protein B
MTTNGNTLLLWVLVAAFLAAVGAIIWAALQLRRSSARYESSFLQAVGANLERAHLFIDAGRILRANLLGVIGVTLAAMIWADSFVVAFLVALLVGVAPNVTLAWLRRRRREQFRQQLPDVMLLTAGGLRAGSSLWQALAQASAELAAPARQEVELMLREQRLGVTLESALTNLERRIGVDDLRLMSAALRIAHDTGGNLAETLESLARTTRRKLTIEGKIHALTAQGRLQAWVMGLLPVLLAAALFQIEPIAMRTLYTTWPGWCVCAAVAVLQAMGFHFIRRIVQVDV